MSRSHSRQSVAINTRGFTTTMKAMTASGLIVFSHGIFDGQLSYLPEIAYFARRGYKIFAFDNSGSHLSGGKSLRGLPQSAEDLDAALSFVTKTNTLPLYLFGHSWGGYAVSAVHCYHLYDIKAVFVQKRI